ncbi:hybrid sensor histidine kinase/response regulator [Spirosoma arboris]|nr:hybrid sensor histidine kinase/response regulator [Spirosoma arboris]
MNDITNTAVLVIDDEELVRNNIEEILVPQKSAPEDEQMRLAASLLFDDPQPLLAPRTSNIPNFTVDKAANGMEGLEMIKRAVAAGRPYAVIFLDMRMPGWDGLETAIHIRKYDKKAEIIFVTAYSDRSLDEVITQAGQNVGYHCKPYAAEEIIQLATKAIADYHKLRNLEELIADVSSISLKGHQLTHLLQNIFQQLTMHLQTDMALLGKLHEDFTYEKLFSIGTVEESVNLERLTALVKSAATSNEDVVQVEELVLTRLDEYTLFAVLNKPEQIKTEKLYLLKLYVQNAAKAIRNAELHEELLQKEKLSAIGQAMSMILHDLRAPLNNIKMMTMMLRQENIQSEWLDLIDECGLQATHLFTDFLDFIKGASIEKKVVDVSELIESSLQLVIGQSNRESIVIQKDIPNKLMLWGDENKLRRVFINLLGNAVEILEAYKIVGPKIVITAWEEIQQGQIVLTISDNGPGIPNDILKTLFNPFVTRQKQNGTGLGLAIVKQYINAHGGAISVANEPGAVFNITLPMAILSPRLSVVPSEIDAVAAYTD